MPAPLAVMLTLPPAAMFEPRALSLVCTVLLLALAAADADAEVDAARLFGGAGVAAAGHFAFVVGDGHLLGFAVDGAALPCLDGVVGVLSSQGGAAGGEGLHAAVRKIPKLFGHCHFHSIATLKR